MPRDSWTSAPIFILVSKCLSGTIHPFVANAFRLEIVWSGPLQIVIALVLLYGTMGPSIWAGVAVLVLTIPLNTFLAKKMRACQKIQMGNKDARVKLMVNLYDCYPFFTNHTQILIPIGNNRMKS
jgi:hypothetical protein